MPTLERLKGRKQVSYLLPPHVESLIRTEAAQRRVRMSCVVAERIAASYGVKVDLRPEPVRRAAHGQS